MPNRGRRTPPVGEPLVVTIAGGAERLSVPPERLAAILAAAQLPVWGQHADGRDVFAWREVIRLAVEQGIDPPPHVSSGWRNHLAATDRGRTNRYSKAKQP